METTLVWFEIPARDLDRAIRFYSEVLGISVEKDAKMPVAMFKRTPDEMSGCIVVGDEAIPSGQGPLLYLNVNGRLEDAIKKAASHGGKILLDRSSLGQYGWRAIILDTEGNRIALHSM